MYMCKYRSTLKKVINKMWFPLPQANNLLFLKPINFSSSNKNCSFPQVNDLRVMEWNNPDVGSIKLTDKWAIFEAVDSLFTLSMDGDKKVDLRLSDLYMSDSDSELKKVSDKLNFSVLSWNLVVNYFTISSQLVHDNFCCDICHNATLSKSITKNHVKIVPAKQSL